MYIKNILDNFKKYSFLLKQLVARDFKVKYKRSVLGVLWSLLYPVLMMAVMAVVFSNVFKFSVPGVNYLVYLMTGLTFFNYYSEASKIRERNSQIACRSSRGDSRNIWVSFQRPDSRQIQPIRTRWLVRQESPVVSRSKNRIFSAESPGKASRMAGTGRIV